MKISIVTIRVPGVEYYDGVTKQWLESYVRFKPKIPHELIVIDSDSQGPPGEHGRYASQFMVYTGGGWDCGAWQFASREIKTDLLVCCNTSTFFVKEGWLERFVEEVEKHGVGLYGPMASLSCYPHLRTPCLVFQPEVIRNHPMVVDSRDKTFAFECLAGQDNLTLWCNNHGFPPRMVTWDGCYSMEDWRKPENVFWKGDQSNLLVKDRHAHEYDIGNPIQRSELTRQADGGQ